MMRPGVAGCVSRLTRRPFGEQDQICSIACWRQSLSCRWRCKLVKLR